MRRRAAKTESSIRCAFCHDLLAELPPPCPTCGTLLHADCRRLARACPTLGCAPRRTPRRPRRDPLLQRAAFTAVWLGFGGFVALGGTVAALLLGAALSSLAVG